VRRVGILLSVAVAGMVLLARSDVQADSTPIVSDDTVTSFDGTSIALTVFHPPGADAKHPVPMVLDSHGWGGTRRHAVDKTVTAFLDRGYGFVSFDQRGHGDSGGQANVMDPDLEVRDTEAVIDRIAELDWAQHEAPDDPVLGAVGGSYGGAYQTMTALAEQESRPGGTRFDALAPTITWNDLPEALAPNGVPRTAWLTILYAAGAKMLPPYIHKGFAEGIASGSMPESIEREFARHSPRWFTDRGVRLDIPVLFGQGTSDNLFVLNQGLRNFDQMLTDRAKAASRFVAFNGGHALPATAPKGRRDDSILRDENLPTDPSDMKTTPTDLFTARDECSGPDEFLGRTLDFFDVALQGHGTTPYAHRYSLTTHDNGRCIELDALPDPTDLAMPGSISTAGAGATQLQMIPIGTGGTAGSTVAGIPRFRAHVTTTTPDTRLFLGLAVGTSPADAELVQNNVAPLRIAEPSTAAPVDVELAGVAVDVHPGQVLYLVVAPFADQFAVHGSRVPGIAQLDDVVLGLPLTGR
jgi:pimeloyl-ACP methyl ester carboxylesterase